MKKEQFSGGIILLLFGGALLASQLRPDLLHAWFGQAFPWALLMTACGLLALAFASLSRSPAAVLIAASITAAAALQAYQAGRALPASPVYLWPLVPALAGLGLFLANLSGAQKKAARTNGLYLLSVSLLAAAIFYAMTAANLNMALTWAFLLILAGSFLLTQSRAAST